MDAAGVGSGRALLLVKRREIHAKPQPPLIRGRRRPRSVGRSRIRCLIPPIEIALEHRVDEVFHRGGARRSSDPRGSHGIVQSSTRQDYSVAADQVTERGAKIEFRGASLEAVLKRRRDSALRLRRADCLAEQIRVTTKVLDWGERDRVDALLDQDADRRPETQRSGKRGSSRTLRAHRRGGRG